MADHPWQSEVLSQLILKLKDSNLKNLQACVLLADYYTPYHAPQLIEKWTTLYSMQYLHMGELYKDWQLHHSHDDLNAVEEFLRTWALENLEGRAYETILNTNQYINSYERGRYIQRTPLCCQKQLLYDTILWIENIFDEIKFDFIIGIERYTMIVCIIRAVSARRGITYLTIIPSRIESSWLVTEHSGYGMSLTSLAHFNKLVVHQHCRRAALDFISRMQNREIGLYASWKSGVYVYSELSSRISRNKTELLFGKKGSMFLNVTKVIISRLLIHSRKLQYGTRILDERRIVLSFLELSVMLKKFLRSFGLGFWGSKAPNLESPFYLWCLHFRPEGSTLVLSDGIDEVEMIERTSRLLPPGVLLYVKENPMMFGWRTRNFYQRIRALPNVRLVDAFYSTSKLLLRCLGVIGLSGTVLLEALAYNKKAIALGNPEFNSILPFVGLENLVSFFQYSGEEDFQELFIRYFCYINSTATINQAAENLPVEYIETQKLINELSLKVLDLIPKMLKS